MQWQGQAFIRSLVRMIGPTALPQPAHRKSVKVTYLRNQQRDRAANAVAYTSDVVLWYH